MIKIDIEKCVSCAVCVSVCPDGIEIEYGKVKKWEY